MSWKPDYATAAQVKEFLGIDAADTADDAALARACTAASRAVDRACLRQFGQSTGVELRTYEARWDRHRPRQTWVAIIDDVQDITGLVVSVGGVVVTDYRLEPRNAAAVGRPYTRLALGPAAEARPTRCDPEIDLTVKWGWTAFPATVVQATTLQAARFKERARAVFGVAGSPQDGSEMRLLERVDPDVRVMLTEYVRWYGA